MPDAATPSGDVASYAQSYEAAPCERCGGGRIDYRLTFENEAVEGVCWSCARASLAVSPKAVET